MKKLFLVLILLSSQVFAALIGFSVATSLPATPEEEESALAGLRAQAVAGHLNKTLGPQAAAQLIPYLKPDVTEGFISDFRPSRLNGKLTLTGNLDTGAIRHWVGIVQTRVSNSVKPCILISSTIPEHKFNPAEAMQVAKTSTLVQATQVEAVNLFKKFNAKALEKPFDRFERPAQGESEISALKTAMPECNTALWINYSPCTACGGSRLDAHLYSLVQTRLVSVASEDLPLPGSAILNAARVKASIPNAFNVVRKSLDDAFSKGTVFSNVHIVSIEGITSFPTFRTIGNELEKLGFASQVSLKKTQPQSVMYEILTSLSAEEFAKELQTLGNLTLKTVNITGNKITMRMK